MVLFLKTQRLNSTCSKTRSPLRKGKTKKTLPLLPTLLTWIPPLSPRSPLSSPTQTSSLRSTLTSPKSQKSPRPRILSLLTSPPSPILLLWSKKSKKLALNALITPIPKPTINNPPKQKSTEAAKKNALPQKDPPEQKSVKKNPVYKEKDTSQKKPPLAMKESKYSKPPAKTSPVPHNHAHKRIVV